MLIAGVIGWPVSHSRSPALHAHWLRRHAIEGAYLPLAVPPDHLATAIRGLAAAGFRGLNVTIPHKETVLALCDRLAPSAARAGAANTLVFTPHGIEASNTDGSGFLANLADHGIAPSPALLIGAGGAARAIAAALLDHGTPVTVTSRNATRAERLAAALPGLATLPWPERETAAAHFPLLVNTTPLGMHPADALPLPLTHATPGAAAADIVYTPRRTRFLAEAEARGLIPVPGLGMLLHQAVPGFAAWFGTTPTVDKDLAEAVSAATPPA